MMFIFRLIGAFIAVIAILLATFVAGFLGFALSLIIVLLISFQLTKAREERKKAVIDDARLKKIIAAVGGEKTDVGQGKRGDYQSVENYCVDKGISEEKAKIAIDAGLLEAKKLDGTWYILRD
jgi:uncharacterized SAM-binding protein YcdF (DUF218 family)